MQLRSRIDVRRRKVLFLPTENGKKNKDRGNHLARFVVKITQQHTAKKKKEKRKLRRESIRNANALIVSKKKVCTVAVRTEIK